ncbi:hypothetical protein FTUN_1011 [Frigoriglobus tundricola]|uniref:Uncharacterized protein n=1 Tax=Frigoriglobus tundricola TaxID=2774151 RepID=A0A6M5YIX7_9BACT|nr:hypothetical protein FTUN_1011 [Frigoriglobus tundricola]
MATTRHYATTAGRSREFFCGKDPSQKGLGTLFSIFLAGVLTPQSFPLSFRYHCTAVVNATRRDEEVSKLQTLHEAEAEFACKGK